MPLHPRNTKKQSHYLHPPPHSLSRNQLYVQTNNLSINCPVVSFYLKKTASFPFCTIEKVSTAGSIGRQFSHTSHSLPPNAKQKHIPSGIFYRAFRPHTLYSAPGKKSWDSRHTPHVSEIRAKHNRKPAGVPPPRFHPTPDNKASTRPRISLPRQVPPRLSFPPKDSQNVRSANYRKPDRKTPAGSWHGKVQPNPRNN